LLDLAADDLGGVGAERNLERKAQQGRNHREQNKTHEGGWWT
jgi:hypothetical protein